MAAPKKKYARVVEPTEKIVVHREGMFRDGSERFICCFLACPSSSFKTIAFFAVYFEFRTQTINCEI